MPSIEENTQAWDGGYDWSRQGEEWSDTWGGSTAQWYSTLYPRLHPFLPAPSICEIAPGHGRWTAFLLELCDELVGIDLSAQCVDSCRERFAGVAKARFEITDGSSLPTVEAESVDLAFSFDSLVHVEAEIIADYLSELARVLKPNGVGWLHHSNLGGIDANRRASADFVDHWRAPTMSADRMVEMAQDNGLICIGQELINWGGADLLDCISLVTRPGSIWDRPLERQHNVSFGAESLSARCISAVYASMTEIGRNGYRTS